MGGLWGKRAYLPAIGAVRVDDFSWSEDAAPQGLPLVSMGALVRGDVCGFRRHRAITAFVYALAVCGTAHAQTLDSQFVDREGKRRSATLRYRQLFELKPQAPSYGRAAVEVGMLLGLGAIWYVAKPGANSVDWDVDSVGEKLDPSLVRFDNNRFATNMLLHPIAGSGYYGVARANRLSIPAAFAYAFTASAIWEYALEWREKVSVNDMITTPLGGMVMGECFVKLVDYVSSGPPRGSLARQTVRYTLGLPHSIHALLDDAPPRDDHMPTDRLGFSSAYAHDFRFGYELAYGVDDRDRRGIQHLLTAQTEIVALPGFLRPGRFDQVFAHGNFTEMSLRMGFAQRGLVDSDVWLRAAFLGYYAQDLRQTRTAPLYGHAYALSLASAFTHTQRWFLEDRDETGIMHLAGPALEAWLTSANVWFRARVEGSVDFAALRPAAFGRYRQRNPEGTIKSALDEFGYDYYVGLSLRALAIVAYRALELGQRVSYGTYDSISGFDRFEERISRSVDSTDLILSYRAWLGVWLYPVQVQLRIENRARSGAVEGVRSGRSEQLTGIGLQLRF